MKSKLSFILLMVLFVNLIVSSCRDTSEAEISSETEKSSDSLIVQYASDELIIYNEVYKTAPDENSDAVDLCLDIYYPTNRMYEKSPVLFLLFGGGWISGDKASLPVAYKPLCDGLRAKGYAIVAVQYRYASPKYYFPSNLEDCIDSILFFKDHEEYDIDVNRSGVMGYSAGAHLAMMTAYAMKDFSVSGDFVDINYCISVSGPTKMYDDDTDRYSQSTLSLVEHLFDGTYQDKYYEYQKGSPYYYLDEGKTAPLLLIQGNQDEVVPYEQSETMFQKAVECGIPVELLTLEGVGHTINIVQGINKNPTDNELKDKIFDFIVANTEQND